MTPKKKYPRWISRYARGGPNEMSSISFYNSIDLSRSFDRNEEDEEDDTDTCSNSRLSTVYSTFDGATDEATERSVYDEFDSNCRDDYGSSSERQTDSDVGRTASQPKLLSQESIESKLSCILNDRRHEGEIYRSFSDDTGASASHSLDYKRFPLPSCNESVESRLSSLLKHPGKTKMPMIGENKSFARESSEDSRTLSHKLSLDSMVATDSYGRSFGSTYSSISTVLKQNMMTNVDRPDDYVLLFQREENNTSDTVSIPVHDEETTTLLDVCKRIDFDTGVFDVTQKGLTEMRLNTTINGTEVSFGRGKLARRTLKDFRELLGGHYLYSFKVNFVEPGF
uniref:Uncharacterized protein n=1 Tax=Corethron hystrix TaxID=216773 RepID=A0A7S1BU45_9STRA